MGKVVFGMLCSLDGYVGGPDGGPQLPIPETPLHQVFNDAMRGTKAMVYGRRMYEIMRYWDDDHAGAPPVEVDFGQVWRTVPKHVVSATLADVGPNAALYSDGAAALVRRLREEVDGTIEIGGPTIAASLSREGLIDEYQLYQHPLVFGSGMKFFPEPLAFALKLVGTQDLPQGVQLRRYAPQR